MGEVLYKWNTNKNDEVMRNRSIEQFEIAIKLQPNDDATRYNYGRCLEYVGEYKSAIIQYRKASELLPRDHDSFNHIGHCYHALKKYQKAGEYFVKAVEIAPNNLKYILDLTALYRQIKNHTKADYYYENALSLEYNEMCFQAHSNILADLIKDHKHALAVDLKLSEKHPSNYQYLISCAYSYWKLNDIDNANKYYLKAIEVDKNNDQEPYRMYGIFLCEEMNDYERAKMYFMKGIEIEPGNHRGYYWMAKMMRDYVHNYDEAEKWYLKGIDRVPKTQSQTGAYGSYGYLLYLKGEYELAMKYIQMELDNDDRNEFGHLYHALVEKVYGNDEKAELVFWRAASIINVIEYDDALIHVKLMRNAKTLNDDILVRFLEMMNCKMSYSYCNKCKFI